jgi:hypothetical protein
MSNNDANPKLTNEQALQILSELSSLDSLKLNLKEHAAVQNALGVINSLVEAAKLTPAAASDTV